MSTATISGEAPAGYDPLSRMLHWFTAIVVMGAFAAGFLSTWLDDAAHRLALSIHQTCGITIIGLTTIRLATRPFRIG